MCPVVESGPTELSRTYCQCSAGYVKEVFERMTGLPCRVEVLESLRTGGTRCRFKIDIAGA
jgi:predicted hydrocarbon binding protein